MGINRSKLKNCEEKNNELKTHIKDLNTDIEDLNTDIEDLNTDIEDLIKTRNRLNIDITQLKRQNSFLNSELRIKRSQTKQPLKLRIKRSQTKQPSNLINESKAYNNDPLGGYKIQTKLRKTRKRRFR